MNLYSSSRFGSVKPVKAEVEYFEYSGVNHHRIITDTQFLKYRCMANCVYNVQLSGFVPTKTSSKEAKSTYSVSDTNTVFPVTKHKTTYTHTPYTNSNQENVL